MTRHVVTVVLYMAAYLSHCTINATPMKIGTTTVLNEMLIDYESDVRPSIENGSVHVYLSVHIMQAQWQSEHLTLVFYLRQRWHDPRLAFKGYSEIRVPTVAAVKLWNPSLFSPSDVESRILDSGYVQILPNGSVTCSQRCLSIFSCPLSPDDVYKNDGKLNCTMAVESYAYEGEHITLHWKEPITIANELSNRLSLMETKEMVSLTSAGNYSRIEATIQLQTDITRQLLNYYIRKLAKL